MGCPHPTAATRITRTQLGTCPPAPHPRQVLPTPEYTLEQLAQHDGSDPARPILLAVRGTVFDVSSGHAFYGKDGMYPFGGHECARALAKMSTEMEGAWAWCVHAQHSRCGGCTLAVFTLTRRALADCVADVDGLSAAEMDTLRDWQAKFWSKYPVVGRVVAAAAGGGAGKA